jgi:hypothetical protein
LVGIPVVKRNKEKFTKVENLNYMESEIFDADILKIRLLHYMYRFKEPNSSGIRSTVEYVIGDGHPEIEAMVFLKSGGKRFASIH